jgi:hypothetical protein
MQCSVLSESDAHPLLSNGLKVSLRLLLFNSTGALRLAVGAALGHGALAASPPHANAVDDETCTA